MFKPDTFKRKINFSSHIPFMQNRELLRGEKLCIHGKVVNAPADVNSTVNTYQDKPMNHKLSLLNLNESWITKHYYHFQNVRPRKVLKAAKYLVKTSEMFQNEHREVQENWLRNPDTRANDALANQNSK